MLYEIQFYTRDGVTLNWRYGITSMLNSSIYSLSIGYNEELPYLYPQKNLWMKLLTCVIGSLTDATAIVVGMNVMF